LAQLLCVGVNYQTASVETRELAAISASNQSQLLLRVAAGHIPEVDELAIISTCNRTELYAVGDSAVAFPILLKLWSEHSGISEHEITSYAFKLTSTQSVKHLFQVAAGLDSQVIGEPQILGQVTEGFERARQHNATGTLLSTLMQHAIQVGKRVRNETELGHGALSISSIAATHSQQILGSLEHANVLIIGAGEMARTAAAAFVRRGVDQLCIANHTHQHAQEIAEQWGGQVVPITQLGEALVNADLVITAAAAPHAILHVADLQTILPQRNGRQLIIFDIALPRNAEPQIAALPGVALFNLDDLQSVTDAHYNIRQNAVPQAQTIVEDELQNFTNWQASRAAVPVIQNLRAKAELIRQTEMDHLLRRLPDLTDHEQQLLDDFSHRLINKLLHEPTLKLKAKSAEGSGDLYSSVVDELFNLALTDK
jgi:glutamyl-tRNA reductase